MATIAKDASTVGDIIDQCTERLFSGLLREPTGNKVLQRDKDRNAAARRAVELLAEDLKEIWCPDANTRLSDVPVPQGSGKALG